MKEQKVIKMKRQKRFSKIIILICIINIFLSIKFIVVNKHILNVNSRNREIVNSILDDGERHYLTKIETYKYWRHYNIALHSFLKTEELVISDGDDNLCELFTYVEQNGYETATIGYMFAISSLIIIVLAKSFTINLSDK